MSAPTINRPKPASLESKSGGDIATLGIEPPPDGGAGVGVLAAWTTILPVIEGCGVQR